MISLVTDKFHSDDSISDVNLSESFPHNVPERPILEDKLDEAIQELHKSRFMDDPTYEKFVRKGFEIIPESAHAHYIEWVKTKSFAAFI